MVKKIGILVFVLILAGSGFFYWQNNQKDIQALNKILPAGVKVAKNLFGFGNEYKVINKIDGYEFKVPSAWKGIEKIEYEDVIDTDLSIKKQTKEDFSKKIVSETNLYVGGFGSLDYMLTRILRLNNIIDLNKFVEEFQKIYSPYAKTERSESSPKIKDFIIGDSRGFKLYTVFKSKTGNELITDEYYFFGKDYKIYIFSHFNDDFVRKFIADGKW
ncbi:MAG: hypothetical protein AAB451_03030 [Patescibacteria group bacterium]